MNIEFFPIEGLALITPRIFEDSRGHFSETWNQRALEEAGLSVTFVQDNQSYSQKIGTVRGLHFQAPPHAQAKLVRVLSGEIIDVAVDIRSGSPTYGQWEKVKLTAKNGKQLLIPEGFLHGFSTLTDDTVVAYKCSDFYDVECEGSVLFSDPDLNIDWEIPVDEAVLSDKDSIAPLLRDIETPFKAEKI